MRQRDPKTIINLTRESVVCERTVIADRPLARMRGLLGTAALPSGEGLLLSPASSIHTAFMRYPIDVVFVGADLRVIKLAHFVAPWRTAGCRHAKATLELTGGDIARRGLGLADRLAVVEPHRVGRVEPQEAPASPELVQTELDPYGSARVLLVASDKRFRVVASTLLTRRGYSVAVSNGKDDVAELAANDGAEVVVIDASESLTATAQQAARLKSLTPPVGVVAVSAEAQPGLSALPVLAKWSCFPALFTAIEDARAREGRQEIGAGNGRH